MHSHQTSVRDEIIEICNKLFIYTDEQKWTALLEQVFHTDIFLDMTSLGGEAKQMKASEICEMWKKGFEGLDAIHHQSGNYLVNLFDSQADVFCYAVATHYKAAASQGKTRSFTGSYEFQLIPTEKGWRLYKFVYHLKYQEGNLALT